ncbi:hypothetical protein GW17_00015676 [Ensete ventricosum]|nr:hypothetical protein GW17_00015676 [Ensete ventricosum]RZR81290.1 hypothetical protein BHM03_00007492 [Ensete ventricosum]
MSSGQKLFSRERPLGDVLGGGKVLFDSRTPPKIPELILSEQAFRKGALLFHSYLSHVLSMLHDIAGGKDLRIFLLVKKIQALPSLSVLLCALTLPALYERYEGEVDHAAAMGIDGLQQLFKKVNSKVLEKIPRGPAKAKKSN